MPPILLPVSDGTRLEVDVQHDSSAGNADAHVVTVCLHPWGALGGSCRDPVVAAVFRAVLSSGAAQTSARFNARGVGASESLPPAASWSSSAAAALASPAQRNERDARDLVDVAAHALREARAAAGVAAAAAAAAGGGGDGRRARDHRPALRLWLIGYSHGSLVASRALPLLRESLPSIDPGAELAGLVLVAPPIGLVCSVFLGARGAFRHAVEGAGRGLPRLALLGTRDNFTSVAQLRAAVGEGGDGEKEDGCEGEGEGEGEGGERQRRQRRRQAVEVRLLEDADHFFWGRVGDVAGEAVAFITVEEEKRRTAEKKETLS